MSNKTEGRNTKEQKQEGEKSQQQATKEPSKKDKEITIKEDEYLALKQEAKKVKDYYDRYLRLQAEFDNAKKRLLKEKDEFIKYANEGIILELLNILDDLQRTVEAAETKHQDLPAFLKGVEMILAHLYEMLKENNVSIIEAKGKRFDPNYHEAIMQVESDEYPEHFVVEELQKGYLLNGRVIRTAKVKVATAKAAKDSQRPQKENEKGKDKITNNSD